MQLSELKKNLRENPGRNLRFFLPTGGKIPPHAHVTEVALSNKKFLDCGGTLRTESLCRLQTWFSDDTDHRLTTSKLLSILELAGPLLETEALEVEVEHEAPFVSQFPIETVELTEGAVFIRLGVKHTACLAEEKCLPPKLNKLALFPTIPEFNRPKCC